MRAPLALTMGDPAGIGGELALALWTAQRRSLPPFYLIDDPMRLHALAVAIGLEPPPMAEIEEPAEAATRFGDRLPVLPLSLPVDPVPGRPDPANGEAVLASIRRAVADCLAGAAAAMVTNPIQKETLYAAGLEHPGHTELLAELAGAEGPPVMMLAAEGLRAVPATIHIPLSQVPARLETRNLIAQGRILADALKRDFGIDSPRIAVAGLNPHAGEGGTIGEEDRTIIAPAIEALSGEGVAVSGPHPADTMFHEAARAGYDAALCMYHDQALIPVKMLNFWEGVNVTLGLPIVRTSPDHGTALTLAGSGRGDPRSLAAALRLAARMAAARARHKPDR